jgi:hypothetical protein
MPVVKDEYYGRLYPHGYDYEKVTAMMKASRKDGWFVDQGGSV